MPRLTVLALLGVLAVAGPAFADDASSAPLDPACFEKVAWEVDPSAEPIRVAGCRAADKVPAADAQGWIEYDRGPVNGSDGGFIRARQISRTAEGLIVFEVQDNGGGSGVFPYRVTGQIGPDGVLKAQGLKIEALPAN